MITALSSASLESAFRAYLLARFEALEVTVPTPTGEGTVETAAPLILTASSGTEIEPTRPHVAILIAEMKPSAVGVYSESLRVQIVAATPFPYPAGITVDDHAALAAAVAAAFPQRPRHGSATYEEDLEAWEDLHEALADEIDTATGYRLGGWVVEGDRTNRTRATIENVLTIRPCCYHPDHDV